MYTQARWLGDVRGQQLGKDALSAINPQAQDSYERREI